MKKATKDLSAKTTTVKGGGKAGWRTS